MKTSKKIFLFLPLALLAIGLFLFLRPTGKTVAVLETKTDSQNLVTVEVTPLSLRTGQPPKFEISFNTHSVELDFSVENLTVLIDSKGTRLERPQWDGSPPGGHHRSGTLTFGQPLTVGGKTTLVIQNREFIWQAP